MFNKNIKKFDTNSYKYIIIYGIVLGVIAKVVDLFNANSLIGYLGLRDIMNHYGIWILSSCIIIIKSKSLKSANINTIIFLISMIFSYYIVQSIAFNYIQFRHLIFWIFAVSASPIYTFIIWNSKNKNLLSFISIIFPVYLLLNEIYNYDFNIYENYPIIIFNSICILILFLIIPKNKNDMLISIVITIVLIPFIQYVAINRIINNLYEIYMFFLHIINLDLSL